MLCDLDILNRFDILPTKQKKINYFPKGLKKYKNLHVNNDSMDFLCIRVGKYKLDVPYLYYRILEHIVHLFHMDLDYRDQLL